MEIRPELLAPVQEWKSLKVVSGLADAIYFGTNNYNMRQKAENFERKELKRVVDFCHNQNPPLKAYLNDFNKSVAEMMSKLNAL